jgi:hypothetical protein
MDSTRRMSTVAYRSAATGMRASDSDRDLALAELSRHFEAGRLTCEELDERTGRALAARTLGDLGELVRDLPSEPGPRAAPPASRSLGRYLLVLPGIAGIGALMVIGVVAFGGSGGNHHPLRALAVLLPTILLIRLMVRRRSADPASRRR